MPLFDDLYAGQIADEMWRQTKEKMETQQGYTAAVWRCHGGRVLHRRARKPDGSLDSRALCGMFEWERHWHEEAAESRGECKLCDEIANP